MSASTPAVRHPANPWIFRPSVDLLIGCGAWSLPLLAVTFYLSQRDAVHVSFVFYFLGVFCNQPHYMATVYRAYRTQLVQELELDEDRWHRTPETLLFTRISWEPLLSARAARRKLKVAEIPGDEPPRYGGKRKLQIIQWGAAYYFQFIRDWLLWR